MRLYPWLMLGLLAACEPPPEIDLGNGTAGATGNGNPSIEIVYPQNNDTFVLESDCSVTIPVAVDLTNFTLQDPTTAEGLVQGQGHYHVEPSITPGAYVAVSEGSSEVTLDGLDLFSGGLPEEKTISISVDMSDNEHIPLNIDGSFDLVEFNVMPPGEACTMPSVP